MASTTTFIGTVASAGCVALSRIQGPLASNVASAVALISLFNTSKLEEGLITRVFAFGDRKIIITAFLAHWLLESGDFSVIINVAAPRVPAGGRRTQSSCRSGSCRRRRRVRGSRNLGESLQRNNAVGRSNPWCAIKSNRRVPARELLGGDIPVVSDFLTDEIVGVVLPLDTWRDGFKVVLESRVSSCYTETGQTAECYEARCPSEVLHGMLLVRDTM